ncbi:MAG: nucleotidyl transferase AbiEii/AbiGii toxin family protein [Desulfobacteraceae bacterium]|uniref:Nucleotidyl transferase AbiEii/AbiGii toxin family protein n=1 Tax=Candidatus Desulfaltia bathyphila TaxID=2841697 RepID=A0A8J6N9B2_9BACT|nr:nucleotidyl transferase AbiEii/AbiGii toxin family protein [Candidatus Desulfaltia bathyphila]MBL7196336.1 nucleotidyl transferase AbiEii/AbiGii toxin family protein [Desulfobacterales bacterium]
MQDLIMQERFELEVLDRLNSGKFLTQIIFGGGTMLRLCHGLNRFSVDLDFWVIRDLEPEFFESMKGYLARHYNIKDSAEKFYTILFELRSPDYPRSLKLEIRREVKKIHVEQVIAYSKYANTQVFLKAVALNDMMKSKLEAFLDRQEIRDIFDMEFLFKRGVPLEASADTLKEVLRLINIFHRRDYTVKLGSLLEKEQREYYSVENFKILKGALAERVPFRKELF